MKKTFSVLVCFILLFCTASAHAGRTDANGGHWDRSTGEYHYHHGYPAHQHTNGICPYAYDDKTGSSSGSSSNSSSSGSSIKFIPVSYDNPDGDYGYEAETDFETKRDAYYSGFEWGVEYSHYADIPDSAYNEGYDEGYKQGFSDGESGGYDRGKEKGYDQGYEIGYDEGNKAGYDEGYNQNVSAQKTKGHSEGYQEASSEYQSIIFGICLVWLAVVSYVYFYMRSKLKESESATQKVNAVINAICLHLNKSQTKTISQQEIEEIFKRRK